MDDKDEAINLTKPQKEEKKRFSYPNGYLEEKLNHPYFKQNNARIEDINIPSALRQNRISRSDKGASTELSNHSEIWGDDPDSYHFNHAKMVEWGNSVPYASYDENGVLRIHDGRHRLRALGNDGYESTPMIVFGDKPQYDAGAPIGKPPFHNWTIFDLKNGVKGIRNNYLRSMLSDHSDKLDIPLDYVKSQTPNLGWQYDEGGVSFHPWLPNSRHIEEDISNGYYDKDTIKREIMQENAKGELTIPFDKVKEATKFLDWESDSLSKSMSEKKDLLYNESKRKHPNWEKNILMKMGATDNFQSAGFMLEDGTMLNFGNGHSRGDDHRIVTSFVDGNHDSGTEGMIEFMQRGNIRLMPESPGINISRQPTEKQWKRLYPIIARELRRNGKFYIDIDDEDGHVIQSYVFEYGRDEPYSIIDKINSFFKK